MRISERSLLMREGFMELHQKGYSISDIAKHFNVSIWCVYDNLQKIADKNNVTRESLLLRVQKPHLRNSKVLKFEDKVNPEDLIHDFDEIHNNLKHIIDSIDLILEDVQEE